MNHPRPPPVLASFPRQRPALPQAYRAIYEAEYRANRGGGNWLARRVAQLESWMHRTIAAETALGQRVLELGAGNLNHRPYESVAQYDVVEPFDALYDAAPNKTGLGRRWRDIAAVPTDQRYDRILSIAVLEHLEDLPAVIARSALQLAPGGWGHHCFPSEGGLLWGLAWRATTGLAYRLRTGLDYGVLMRFEHINTAADILAILQWFFAEVSLRRFPLPSHHASLYTCARVSAPRLARCEAYLAGVSVAVRG